MRFVAMFLVLISALLLAPETRLSSSANVSAAFLPERVSKAPVNNLTPPLEPRNSVALVNITRPVQHPKPELAVFTVAEALPAFDATPAAPLDGPIVRIMAAQSVPTPDPIVPDVAEPEVVAEIAEAIAEPEAEPVVVADAPLAPEAEAPIADVAAIAPADPHLVTAAFVNMREGPSSRFGVVTVITGGETADVMERQGNWAHVRMVESGSEGWIFSRYLAPKDDV